MEGEYSVYVKSYKTETGWKDVVEIKIEAGKTYYLQHDDMLELLKKHGVTLGEHMYQTEWERVSSIGLMQGLNSYIRSGFKLVGVTGYD